LSSCSERAKAKWIQANREENAVYGGGFCFILQVCILQHVSAVH